MRDHHSGYDFQAYAGQLADELALGDVRFTIGDGQVTGLERVIGSRIIAAGLPANASFVVGDGTVTQTLVRATATATLTYTADTNDKALYHLTREVRSYDTAAPDTPTYRFAISAGRVTAMSQTFGTADRSHSVAVDHLPASAFRVDGADVTQTTIRGNTLETLRFTTTDGATYKLASETLSAVPAGTATTVLDVEPYERMRFTFSGAAVTHAEAVKTDGTTIAVPRHPGVTYAQAAPGYVVETITRGAHTFYEVFHDGSGNGIYTAVAHGTGTMVDLAGLQAQITEQIGMLL
jgi:hypothetical protein